MSMSNDVHYVLAKAPDKKNAFDAKSQQNKELVK